MQQQELSFEKQKELQQLLAAYNRETQFTLAAFQRETALSQPEANKFYENWPLNILPSIILGSHSEEDPIPLRIFILPPNLNYDRFGGDKSNSGFPRIERYLKQTLKDFLDLNYPQDGKERPTEFLDGAFESTKYHGQASVKVLFSMLRSEPTLILESEIDGDYLNFHFAYWGIAFSKPVCKTVLSRFPFKEMVYESVKKRALKWKPTYERLKQKGDRPEVFNEVLTNNLLVLGHEDDCIANGEDPALIQHRYIPQLEDFLSFFEFLSLFHCLLAAWAADFHHLTQYETMPALPGMLPEL